MDNSIIHLMEFTDSSAETKTIEHKTINQKNVNHSEESEVAILKKELHNQSEIYKNLGDIIKIYDEVILFGPIDPKAELYSTFSAEHSFAKTKIEIKQTDKMTESQQYIFVK